MHRLAVGFLLSAATALASPSSSLDSQARAQRVLAAAVEAIGGEGALRGLQSIHREYLEDWVDVGQGQRPWLEDPPAGALPPHHGFDDSEGISFLDYGGNRYYESIRYADSANDYAVIVESGTPALAFQKITYVRERPFFTEHAADDRRSQRLPHFRRHLEGLLRVALDRLETLISLGKVEDGNATYDVIAFADGDGTQIRLYFDTATHRLIRSETLRGHRVYGDTTRDTVFSDFRRVGRLELPYEFTHRIDGIPVSRNTIRTIAVDAPAQPEWFQPPGDFAAIEPTLAAPAVEPLGGGVYMIRGIYNLMFAEFRDHVLLIEAPIGEPYTKTVLDFIASTVPGKPIRLVSTHFHFDHIGGTRTAVARGIPILTTADARGVIDMSLASRQVMRPDELTRQHRAPRIEVVAREMVLDDGTQRVELYDFGPTPHVAELLVAYFPRQKLLHAADIFDVLTPELVIAGVDAVVMAERIRKYGLDVERIVPMHGVPVTIEHLRRGLEIREKYQEDVE